MALNAYLGVRVPQALKDEWTKWLTKLNEGRRIPLSEADLVRGLLEYGVQHKVPWEGTRTAVPATTRRRAVKR